MQNIPSTADARTINNVARHEYRVLSDDEKALMGLIKDKGAELIGIFEGLKNTNPGSGREYALAITKMEEAVMWAVKGLTK